MSVKDFLEEHPEFADHSDVIFQLPSIEAAVEKYPELEGEPEIRDYPHRRTRTSAFLSRLGLYIISRRQGSSHAFAAACACQTFPSAMTDDVFWGGRAHFADVYGETYYNEIKSSLAAQGVTLGAHDEYMPELAEYKGDPRAVVSRAQGRSYIKQRCEERGLACEGGVRVKEREPTSDPLALENCVPLADELVESNFKAFAEANPDEARKMSKQDAKDAMTQKHGAIK